MTALIIHGAYGTPQENWFSWLAGQIEQLNYSISIPQLPTPNNQSLTSWLDVIQPIILTLDNHSLIIGHSIGATFALRVLEQLDHPVKATALVSGFISNLPDPELNAINHTFYDAPFN